MGAIVIDIYAKQARVTRMQKEALISTLVNMPAEVDTEQVIEKILFLKNLDEATTQADANKFLSEKELRDRLSQWLN